MHFPQPVISKTIGIGNFEGWFLRITLSQKLLTVLHTNCHISKSREYELDFGIKLKTESVFLTIGLGISELFRKSGMKQVASMAKFGVEYESVKIFDLRWHLIPLMFENSKWSPKWHIFARKWLIFIQYWLITCLFIGYLGQGMQIWNS